MLRGCFVSELLGKEGDQVVVDLWIYFCCILPRLLDTSTSIIQVFPQ